MRVLLLTPIPHYLADAVEAAGDKYSVSMDEPQFWPEGCDFVVSFGYKTIIPQKVIDHYRGRLINIHISLLPWNRGADPNFWSWFDRTPKGVSIHAIDAGIDTGDILSQAQTAPSEGHTLRTSYSEMVQTAAALFDYEWPAIRRCDWTPTIMPNGGSYHRIEDKTPWMNKLSKGWDTPVSEVEELGAAISRNN